MIRAIWSSDFIDEYELDSEGNPIETIEGPKSTARARTVERALRYKPRHLDQLPPELLRHTRAQGWIYPPRYNFGWGVSYQQLYDYCIECHLVPKKYHGNFARSVAMVQAAVKGLDRRCGTTLYLRSLSDAEHVARFSNLVPSVKPVTRIAHASSHSLPLFASYQDWDPLDY